MADGQSEAGPGESSSPLVGVGPDVTTLEIIDGHERKAKVRREDESAIDAGPVAAEENHCMITIAENTQVVKSGPSEAFQPGYSASRGK